MRGYEGATCGTRMVTVAAVVSSITRKGCVVWLPARSVAVQKNAGTVLDLTRCVNEYVLAN